MSPPKKEITQIKNFNINRIKIFWEKKIQEKIILIGTSNSCDLNLITQ